MSKYDFYRKDRMSQSILAQQAVRSQKALFNTLNQSTLREFMFRATDGTIQNDFLRSMADISELSSCFVHVRTSAPGNKMPSIYINLYTNARQDVQLGHLSLHIDPTHFNPRSKGPLHVINNQSGTSRPFFVNIQPHSLTLQNTLSPKQSPHVNAFYQVGQSLFTNYFTELHKQSLENPRTYMTKYSNAEHPSLSTIQSNRRTSVFVPKTRRTRKRRASVS